MVMLRPKGKAEKVAKAVMKQNGLKLQENKKEPKKKVSQGPYLLH